MTMDIAAKRAKLTAERVRDAVSNPGRYERWRLDLLRSDANFHKMYEEEDALRRIVAEREAQWRGWERRG